MVIPEFILDLARQQCKVGEMEQNVKPLIIVRIVGKSKKN
jgi:hypothetical protein